MATLTEAVIAAAAPPSGVGERGGGSAGAATAVAGAAAAPRARHRLQLHAPPRGAAIGQPKGRRAAAVARFPTASVLPPSAPPPRISIRPLSPTCPRSLRHCHCCRPQG